MGEKEKKQLMVAIPLLAVAFFMVFWFIIKPQLRGGKTSPTTTTTTTTSQPTGDQVPAPVTDGGAAAAAGDISEHGAPDQPARSDPFVSFTKRRVIPPDPTMVAMVTERATPWKIPPVRSAHVGTIEEVGTMEEPHERRMAGMLHNGRVWAIYEKDGISQVVKPGDPVGEEIVVAIGKDTIVLRSLDGREREVSLERLTGYEAPGTTGYTPGTYAPGGPPRPPAPPGPIIF